MRGDGPGEDVDGDCPLDERIIGDDVGDDFPLPEGCFPGRIAPPEPYIGSAQIPPRDSGASSRKLLYDFFPWQNTPYSRRWTSGACQVAHKAGARPGGRPRPHPLWMAGGSPLVLSSSNIFIYSKIILHKFYRVWTSFDMDFLRNKNMQQTGTGTGHWISKLVLGNVVISKISCAHAESW